MCVLFPKVHSEHHARVALNLSGDVAKSLVVLRFIIVWRLWRRCLWGDRLPILLSIYPARIARFTFLSLAANFGPLRCSLFGGWGGLILRRLASAGVTVLGLIVKFGIVFGDKETLGKVSKQSFHICTRAQTSCLRPEASSSAACRFLFRSAAEWSFALEVNWLRSSVIVRSKLM